MVRQFKHMCAVGVNVEVVGVDEGLGDEGVDEAVHLAVVPLQPLHQLFVSGQLQEPRSVVGHSVMALIDR